jgi:enamine deaminase RidA (YjgF/YER057c/UK114 family)
MYTCKDTDKNPIRANLFHLARVIFQTNADQYAKFIEAQTQLTPEKIDLTVTEAGSSRQQVIQMRIYISDIALWDKVNEVYTRFFGCHKPARCVVPTRELHYGCLIEAECVAGV